MTEVYRQDSFTLDAASGFDPQTGLFRGTAILARVGVFPYLRKDGSVQNEFVPPEELHDPEWIKTCRMAPVTDGHPDELVTEANSDKVVVGQLGETIVKHPSHIEAPLGVHRKDTLAAMRSGKLQISCGFTTVLVARPGEYQGQRYDAVQTQRRCNHVAIVDRGRHGPEVRIRMDGAASMVAPDDPAPKADDTRSKTMAQVNLGRITVDVADAGTAQAIVARMDELQRQADAALETAKTEKTVRERIEGERDAHKTRADAAEVEKAEIAKTAEQKVRARMDLEARARKVLGAEAKCDGSDDELRVAVLKKLDSGFDGTGRSGEYIAGRFDTALELHEKSNSAAADVRRDIAPSPSSSGQQLTSEQLRAAAVMVGRARAAGIEIK